MSVSLYNIGKNRRKRGKRHGSCSRGRKPDAGEVLLPEGWRSALRTFDLADVPYPRDPESPRLRDLKRAVTEECLRGSGR